MQNFLYLTFSKKDLARVFRPFPTDAVAELHLLHDTIRKEGSYEKLKEVDIIVTDVIERFQDRASTLIIDTSSIREMNFISVVIATTIRQGLMICFDYEFDQNVRGSDHEPYGIYKSLGNNDKAVQKNAVKALSLMIKRSNPWKQENPLMDEIMLTEIDQKSAHNFNYKGTEYVQKIYTDTGECVTYKYPILRIYPRYITFVDQKDGLITSTLIFTKLITYAKWEETKNGFRFKTKIHYDSFDLNILSKKSSGKWVVNVGSLDVELTFDVIDMKSVSVTSEITSGKESGLKVKHVQPEIRFDTNFDEGDRNGFDLDLEEYVLEIMNERFQHYIRRGTEPSKTILFPIQQKRIDDETNIINLCLLTAMLIRMGFGPIFE